MFETRPAIRGVLAVLAIAAAPCVARAADATPPSYVLTAWTADKGLPAGDIWAMAQDADGYLWLGTQAGLVRFDGSQFVPWGAHGEPPLTGRAIQALTTTRDGSLWVGFADVGGATRIRDGRATHFSEHEGLSTRDVAALVEDRNGTLWAGSRAGLFGFDGNQWRRIGHDSALPDSEVYSVYEDRDGSIWAGTAVGVFRKSAGAHAFQLVSAERKSIQSIAQDPTGTLWVNDTERIVIAVDTPRRPELAADVRLPTPGWRLLRSTRGHVWIAALGGGLLRLTPGERTRPPTIERISYEPTMTGSPRSLFEDRENNIWVGMRGGGLLRLSEAVVRTDTRLEGLTNDGVRALTADREGRVWAATGHNLNVFSGAAHEAYDIAQSMALYTDRQGHVWALTHEGLGQVIGGRMHLVPLPRPIRFEWITSLTSDAAGDIWLCSVEEGVLRLSHGVLSTFDDAPEVNGKACNAVFADSNGRVWVGLARGGVAVYDAGRFTTYGPTQGLANGAVMAIYEDSTNAIWISTGSGVSRYRDDRFATLDASNGLPDGIVPALIDDREGFMWLGVHSGSGLIRFSRDEIDTGARAPGHLIQYVLYDVSDGLQGVLHWRSRPGAVRSGDGNLWFVTGTGVAVVDPHQLPRQRAQAAPRIERVVVNGNAYTSPGRLALPRGSTNLQFEYSALGLSAASKLRFRYMLEGLSPDWMDAGARREVSFSNVPPGDYRFRVSATTDGVWNEAQTVWAFSIPPPIYQTSTFYVASALMAAFALWLYWTLRMRRMRSQFAVVLNERARVSREIHDTLLQDLGAIRLELEVVATRLDASHHEAGDSLHRLHAQVGRCIREARHSIWELRSPRVDARDLATGLQGLAADVRENKATEVKVVVRGALRQCPREVEEQLLRIAQEALNNAVQHGQAQRIDVTLDYADEALSLRVVDNGVGFVASSTDSANGHWGLVNMKERAASIGARFAIQSEPGGGTSIDVVVPLIATGPATAGHYVTAE